MNQLNVARTINTAIGCSGIGATVGGAMLTAYGIKNLTFLQSLATVRPLTEEEAVLYNKYMTEIVVGTGVCLGGAALIGLSNNYEYTLGQTSIIQDILKKKLVINTDTHQIIQHHKECTVTAPAPEMKGDAE